MKQGKHKADSPGVRYPPPVLYVTGFLIGYGLTLLVPLGAWPALLPRAVGASLAALGVLIAFWAIALFWLNRTAVFPHKPASTLISRRGPYRFTRNPMYLSLSLAYLGVAIFVRTGWAILLLPLVLAAVTRMVIAREEAYLERRFGDEYLSYKKHVRRWV